MDNLLSLPPIEYLGLVAGFASVICYVPQAIKTIRSRDTRAISLVMYCMLAAGVALWLLYGFMTGSPGLIACNAISFVLISIILAMKIKHG